MKYNRKLANISLILIVVLVMQITLTGCKFKLPTHKTDNDATPTATVTPTTKPTETPTTATPKPATDSEYTEDQLMAFYNGYYVPDAGSELTEEQRNSANMLNYLMVLTQEITDSSSSNLYLQQTYSRLIDNTYPNAVDDTTQEELNELLDTLDSYRQVEVKRDRLDYIYEQNQADAVRQAVPNPLGMMSTVQSGNLAKLAASVVYMAVDSAASYESAMSTAELQYIEDNWELDDEKAEALHNSLKNSFNYMISIVNDMNLPGDLALSQSAVEDYVTWNQESNVTQRIQFLQDNQDIYENYAPYWLEMARDYYEAGNNSRCLACVFVYDQIQTRIFRLDYDYANTLPYAIIAASETLSEDNYEMIADQYAQAILDNTDYSDWSLRYFAAQTYVDLYARTNDTNYLQKAYDIELGNVNGLVSEQREQNETYLADIVKRTAKDDATKAEKEEIKAYNSMLEDERKTELPPVYEPLKINCELLYALADQLNINELQRNKQDQILHENGDTLFLTEQLDNAFQADAASISESDIDIDFDGEKLTIPAQYVADDALISVSVTDDNGTTSFDDWSVDSVNRNKSNKIEKFTVQYSSVEAGKYEYSDGCTVTITISMGDDNDVQSLNFKYTGNASGKFGPFGGSIKFERKES